MLKSVLKRNSRNVFYVSLSFAVASTTLWTGCAPAPHVPKSNYQAPKTSPSNEVSKPGTEPDADATASDTTANSNQSEASTGTIGGNGSEAPVIVDSGSATGTNESQDLPPEKLGCQETEVSRDNHYVYFRTPWRAARKESKKVALNAAVQLFKSHLSLLFDEKGRKLSSLFEKSEALNKFTKESQNLSQVNCQSGIEKNDLIPSGFMLLVGGKGTADLGFGLGAGANLVLVLVPNEIRQVSLQNGNQIRSVVLDWALMVMPGAHAGVGVGAGGTFRFGAGAIWGNLNNAKEFTGAMGDISGTAEFGIGLTAKGGILRNIKQHKTFPFAIFLGEIGAAADAGAHFEGSALIALDSIARWPHITEAFSGKEVRFLPKPTTNSRADDSGPEEASHVSAR